MGNFDQTIYGKLTFGDLLKEIHKKTNEKDELVKGLIKDLSSLQHNINDAIVLVPLIKQYMDLSMDANEHLIKMAAIVQKALDKKSEDPESEFMLTEQEKAQILGSAEIVVKQLEAIKK